MTRSPQSGSDAVGSYDNPKHSSKIVPIILGLLALLGLLLLILWLSGAFSDNDVDRNEITPIDRDNAAVIDGDSTNVGDLDEGMNDDTRLVEPVGE